MEVGVTPRASAASCRVKASRNSILFVCMFLLTAVSEKWAYVSTQKTEDWESIIRMVLLGVSSNNYGLLGLQKFHHFVIDRFSG